MLFLSFSLLLRIFCFECFWEYFVSTLLQRIVWCVCQRLFSPLFLESARLVSSCYSLSFVPTKNKVHSFSASKYVFNSTKRYWTVSNLNKFLFNSLCFRLCMHQCSLDSILSTNSDYLFICFSIVFSLFGSFSEKWWKS